MTTLAEYMSKKSEATALETKPTTLADHMRMKRPTTLADHIRQKESQPVPVPPESDWESGLGDYLGGELGRGYDEGVVAKPTIPGSHGATGSWDVDPHAVRMSQAKQAFAEDYAAMPEAKQQATAAAQSQDFFGISEYLSRKNIHPVEWLTKVISGTDVRGYGSAEKEAISEIMADKPLKNKLIHGLAQVPMIAAEFAVPGAIVGKAGKSVQVYNKIDKYLKAMIQAGTTFGLHEAMQAPRKDEELMDRVGTVDKSVLTGMGVGLAGKALSVAPEATGAAKAAMGVARGTIIPSGFAAKTYAETGDVDAAIEAAVIVAGFQALGLSKQAGRYFKQKYQSMKAGKGIDTRAKLNEFFRHIETEIKSDAERARAYYRKHGTQDPELLKRWVGEKPTGKPKQPIVTPQREKGGIVPKTPQEALRTTTEVKPTQETLKPPVIAPVPPAAATEPIAKTDAITSDIFGSAEVKAGYSVTGNKVEYIKMSKAKGKEYFADLGFVQSRNPNYMEKGNTIVYYNSRNKAWHISRPSKEIVADVQAEEAPIVPESEKIAPRETTPEAPAEVAEAEAVEEGAAGVKKMDMSLMQKARKYKTAEEFIESVPVKSRSKKREIIKEWKEKTGYKPIDSSFDRGDGIHSPSDPKCGSPLYDVTENGIYPEDVYSANGLRYYGTGEDVMDREAYRLITYAEGRPGAITKIYRAVEKTDKQKIVPGDWVTTVRAYAKEHGEGTLKGDYKIISKTVSAGDIFTSGDSWLEYGYHPQKAIPTKVYTKNKLKLTGIWNKANKPSVQKPAPVKAPAKQPSKPGEAGEKAGKVIDVRTEKTISSRKAAAIKQLRAIVKTLPETGPTYSEKTKKYLERAYDIISRIKKRQDRHQQLKHFNKLYKVAGIVSDIQKKELVEIKINDDLTMWIPPTQEGVRSAGNIENALFKMVAVPSRVKAVKPKSKPKPKLAPTKVTPIKIQSPKNILKVVYDTAAAKEHTRHAINGVRVDEDTMVATDGRTLFVVERKGAFKSIAQKYEGMGTGAGASEGTVLLGDGKKIEKVIDSETGKDLGKPRFPAYQDIITKDSPVAMVDPQKAYNDLKRAARMTTEGSGGVRVYVNPDNTLGFTAVSKETGTAKINVQDNAELITAVNPVFFMKMLKGHIQLGAKEVTIHATETTKPLKITDNKGATSVIMPAEAGEEGKFRRKYDRREAGFIMVPTEAEIRGLISFRTPSTIAKFVGSLPGLRQSVDKLIKMSPKHGKTITKMFYDTTDREKALIGQWIDELYEAMGKLSREEQANYNLARRGEAKPMNDKVAKAVKDVKALYDRIGDLKEDVKMPVAGEAEELLKKKGDYHTLVWSNETTKAVQRQSGELYNKLVDWIADDMVSRNLEYNHQKLTDAKKDWSKRERQRQARQFLKDARRYDVAGRELTELYEKMKQGDSSGTKYQSKQQGWQYHRAFNYPEEFLEKNPYRAAEQFIYSSARRVAEAEMWGPKSEILRKTLRDAAKEVEDVARSKNKNIDDEIEDFLQSFGQILGYESNIQGLQSKMNKKAKKVLRGMRVATGGIQLFGIESPIRNAIWGQMVSMTHFGLFRPHAHFLRTLFSKERIRAAKKAGALEHSGIKHLFAEGIAPEIVAIVRAPMGLAEKLLRTSAAHCGLERWERAIKGVHKRKNKTAPGWLMRELTRRDVGFTETEVNKMIKMGVLTEAQKTKMMRGAVNITQFSADAKDIPLLWSTEGGRFATQFWSMAYKHTQNTVGYSLDEMGHGEYRPIMRLAVAAMFAGLSIDFLYNVLRGRSPRKDDLDKLDKYLRWAGNAMGFIDMPLRVLTAPGVGQKIKYGAPASIGTAAQMAVAAQKAIELATKPKQYPKERKEREASARKAAMRTSSIGRTVEGVRGHYEAGRGLLQDELGIPFSKKRASDYFRGALKNLYRETVSEKEIRKLKRWGSEHDVDTVKEIKSAKSSVRTELYDEMAKAKHNGDMKEYHKLKRRIINELSGNMDDIAKAMKTRMEKYRKAM